MDKDQPLGWAGLGAGCWAGLGAGCFVLGWAGHGLVWAAAAAAAAGLGYCLRVDALKIELVNKNHHFLSHFLVENDTKTGFFNNL